MCAHGARDAGVSTGGGVSMPCLDSAAELAMYRDAHLHCVRKACISDHPEPSRHVFGNQRGLGRGPEGRMGAREGTRAVRVMRTALCITSLVLQGGVLSHLVS